MADSDKANSPSSNPPTADKQEHGQADAPGQCTAGPGRVYYLVCLCCRSRLEVADRLAGADCKCPTCGISFAVPDLPTLRQSLGEPVSVGQMLDERVAPHAYAAAGEMAPEVIEDIPGKPMIRCRRCGTMTKIDANACRSCGMPFTIEAGSFEAAPVDGWAIASVVLGMASLAVFYVPVVAAAAVFTGLMALRRLHVHYSGAQRVAAWSGVVLGGLATIAYVARFFSCSRM